MRTAPPVVVEAAPTASFRAIHALLAAGAAASVAAWAAQHLGRFDLAVGAGAAAGLVGAALGWRVPATRRAHLAWTGADWELRLRPDGGDGVPGVVPEVAIDLGAWMLVRVRRPGARTIWVEVAAGSAGAPWPAWRAAVYSPASQSSRRSSQEQSPS